MPASTRRPPPSEAVASWKLPCSCTGTPDDSCLKASCVYISGQAVFLLARKQQSLTRRESSFGEKAREWAWRGSLRLIYLLERS